MTIDFTGRVVLITGAGSGLGKAHALGFAARGAFVVVNDLGPEEGSDAAKAVTAEICANGGRALATGADVADEDQVTRMVSHVEVTCGKVDVLIANAGILRDKSFANMAMGDFRKVVDVHLIGSANCAKAVWKGMREQRYGRIVFTSSASGLYGNFGQANYGAAKAGLVGLMNVLHLEGERYNIRVNALAPIAATQMTRGSFPPDQIERLQPAAVTPGVVYLASENAPSRVVLCAGGGCFARTVISETEGVYLPPEELSAEAVAANFGLISDTARQRDVRDAFDQSEGFAARVLNFEATVPSIGRRSESI